MYVCGCMCVCVCLHARVCVCVFYINDMNRTVENTGLARSR